MAIGGSGVYNPQAGYFLSPPATHGAPVNFAPVPNMNELREWQMNKQWMDAQRAALSQKTQQSSKAFSTLMPMIKQMALPGGGQGGGMPNINSGPVMTPQAIQQQINAARAYTDRRTESTINDAQNRMTARGYGPQSPILEALRTSMEGQGLAANVGSARDLNLQAAMTNAAHTLEAQKAIEQNITQRQQTEQAKMNALLQALMGFAA